MKSLETCQKITEYYIYFLLSFYLLFTGLGKGYEDMTDWKQTILLAVGGLYILLMIMLSIFGKSDSRKLSISQKLILIYVACTWISAILSEYFPRTIMGVSRGEGALMISIYAMSFFFISMYGKANRKQLILSAVCTIIFCGIAFTQFMGYNPFHLYPAGYNYYDANKHYFGQFVSTIGNVDLVSAFLCPVTAMFFVSLYRSKGKQSLLYLVAFVVGAFVILKINVKSGILGITLGLILAMPIILHLKTSERKKLALIILALALAGIFLIYSVDIGAGMFHELHQLMHGNVNPNFGTGRIKIWTNVIDRIPEKLFFGYGPDTMLFAGIEPWQNYVSGAESIVTAYIDTAHNEYLNILYHQGIFALISFVSSILFILFKTIKANDFSPRRTLLFIYVLCFCIQAFFNISSCMSSIYFYIALGLLDNDLTYKKKNIK